MVILSTLEDKVRSSCDPGDKIRLSAKNRLILPKVYDNFTNDLFFWFIFEAWPIRRKFLKRLTAALIKKSFCNARVFAFRNFHEAKKFT